MDYGEGQKALRNWYATGCHSPEQRRSHRECDSPLLADSGLKEKDRENEGKSEREGEREGTTKRESYRVRKSDVPPHPIHLPPPTISPSLPLPSPHHLPPPSPYHLPLPSPSLPLPPLTVFLSLRTRPPRVSVALCSRERRGVS